MLDSVRRMQEGGILDDFEVRVLLDQINILVKSLAQIPLSMPTPGESQKEVGNLVFQTSDFLKINPKFSNPITGPSFSNSIRTFFLYIKDLGCLNLKDF